ncbi:glycosyltransferase family 39 protein [Streptomyces sp. NBC_00690]|uniref:glycosyltransferase family 39 protein n=1 Tax=Streptomyces sp. NBC_00690 TaxID=2975808 RepID=UPI002E2B532C|nr:glycosyltransferase family 39 protein [Streptomyces sp. NBC_00690]
MPTHLPSLAGPPPRGSAPRTEPPASPRRALALFVAVKALCLAVLFLWAQLANRDAYTLLSARWDSLWYVRVVEHGYDFTLTAPDGRVLSDMAFFPLLPWLEEGLSAITPLGPADAGVLISAVASIAAAWGIFRVVDAVYGERAALFTVAIWGALPVAIVQSMAYSESLFTALAAWALYTVQRRNWLLAGVLASLAGLTRPVGLAVAAALWVAALLAWKSSTDRRRLVAGVVLAPLGAAGYVLWVGQRTGSLFGYLDVQGAWGNGFDGGVAFARFIGEHLFSPAFAAGLGLLAAVVLVGWLYVRGVRQGQPPSLLVYCGIVVVLALCSSGFFGSKPRLLMPAFPLLIPLGLALARTRAAVAWSVVAGAAAVAAVYGAFWLHGSGPP